MNNPTERQYQCFKLYQELGSYQKVADTLCLARETVRMHVAKYRIATGEKVVFDDKERNLKYQYKDEVSRFEKFAPPGFTMGDKVTTFISMKDEENEDKQINAWVRYQKDPNNYDEIWKFLEDRTPIKKGTTPAPTDFRKDLMLEWLLMDHHLGLKAWADETGEGYTTEIAQRLIINAAKKIFALHGPVQKIVIVLGGDNQHADNRSNETERAKHNLYVDGKYPQMVDALWVSMVATIDIALFYGVEIEVMVLSGNHDHHSAINMSRILAAHYRSEPRVKIRLDATKHMLLKWGTSSFMYTHGDTGTNQNLAHLFMELLLKKGWSESERKLIRRGHLHKYKKSQFIDKIDDCGTVQVELFNTLAAADSYAFENGFTNQRATVSNMWHIKNGLRSRLELQVRELLEMDGNNDTNIRIEEYSDQLINESRL